MENPKICLNMIVKDEADIIAGTLENICEAIKISYWVICDTGSSDNTRELITNFFKGKNIPGELHDTPWKDFGYNRTKALELAKGKSDFVLIFDADDRIYGKVNIANLKFGSGYHLNFGTGISWKRLCLIDNNLDWYYSGVMHEIIGCHQEFATRHLEGDYHVKTNVVVSARNKQGQDKFLHDAEKLVEAYNKGGVLKQRYCFYAGECYRFSSKSNWDKSIEWYTKCANDTKTWEQERYWSCYQIGNMYKDMGDNEKAKCWWLRSYEYDTSRKEAIYELIKLCRERNEFKQADLFYSMLTEIREEDKPHKLFIINHIYDHSLYSEMFIIYNYVQKFDKQMEVLLKLFVGKHALPVYINMTNHNLQFYLNNIKSDNYEFCVKFLKYCKTFNIQHQIKEKILKIFNL